MPHWTEHLRRLRRQAGISQMELGLRLGVSQRHVSFVERGLSRPSRGLVLAWTDMLGAAPSVRDAILVGLHFAPAQSAAPAMLDPANTAALEALLQGHEPYPALVLDGLWNLRQMNRGGAWLLAMIGPETPPAGEVNVLDMLCAPDGLADRVLNLAENGPRFLRQLQHEAAMLPALQPRVEALEQMLRARLPAELLEREAAAQPGLAAGMTTHFQSRIGRLSFFWMFTTFGTPLDISAGSLRVEHMFPCDAATERHLREHAAMAG